jgi:hypothetical protein
MKALFSSVAAWWDGLSLRERRMLAIMGALVLGVVGWLGFRLDRVTTAQAFGWLAVLEQGGARIEELGVVENADGTLGVTGALASGG